MQYIHKGESDGPLRGPSKIMEYHPMTPDKANIVEEEWVLLEQKNSLKEKEKKHPKNQNNNNKIMKAENLNAETDH